MARAEWVWERRMMHTIPADGTNLPAQAIEAAVRRAEAEYLEMPGLTLTQAQAARLWSCDALVAGVVLERLTASRFLQRTRGGSFCRA
jgi:hypothetical protein